MYLKSVICLIFVCPKRTSKTGNNIICITFELASCAWFKGNQNEKNHEFIQSDKELGA